MYIVDTNIHVATLLKDYERDNETLRYIEFYNSLNLKDRIVTDFILVELESVIFQVVPRRYALNELEKRNLFEVLFTYLKSLISDVSYLTADRAVVADGMSIFEHHLDRKYLSLADCLIIALAKKEKVKILSRDKRLVEVANGLGVNCFE